MRINPQYSGGNRLISENSAPSLYFIESCTFAMNVSARRLHEVLIEERGAHQRIALKMDVEGHEPILLAELLTWLEVCRDEKLFPEALLVMFEYNRNAEDDRDRLIKVLKGFTSLGAKLYHLPEKRDESHGRIQIEAGCEAQSLDHHGEVFIELQTDAS